MSPSLRVPLLDLPRQHAPLRDELLATVARVLDSGRLVLGPEVEAFEREIAAFSGSAHAVGVSSGSDALLSSLMAQGIGPGDEVVTTPFSFFATVGAIVRLGATPVFADLDEHMNLDVDAALHKITPRARAIVPVPLFGRPLDATRLAASGVPVIVDGAQAVGTPDLAGGGVTAATLSFFPTKNLGALGDGGCVLTEDAAFADRVRLLRQHGSRPKYHHAVVGGNFRLDALQAAVLRVKLAHLRAWNERRRENAAYYRGALEGLAARGLVLPADHPHHVYHHYVVRVDDTPGSARRRDALRKHLGEAGVETEVYYPEPLHTQPSLAHLGYREGDLPRAEAAARQSLAIPVHAEVDEAQRTHVADRVRAFFAGGA